MPTSTKTPLSIRIDPELKGDMLRVAAQQNRSVTNLVETALRAYFKWLNVEEGTGGNIPE